MDALKFLKLDMKLMRSQIRIFFIYPVMGLIIIYFIMNDITFILGYMTFGFAIMATTPFSIENTKHKRVFYFTLPARIESMVLGRFLTLIFAMVFFAVMSMILVVLSLIKGGTVTNLQIFYYSIFASASFILCLFQYILFFELGVMKSQQFFVIIQMLPGMVIWLSMSFGSKYILQNQDRLTLLLDYGRRHIIGAVMAEILFMGVIFYISYRISCQICREKEF